MDADGAEVKAAVDNYTSKRYEPIIGLNRHNIHFTNHRYNPLGTLASYRAPQVIG